ncbi:MAG TPA: DUF4160 domain-containing protein, partial [Polyangiaceae bacterium]
ALGCPCSSLMPTISRYFGIVIRMYFDDHAPPHFHASYGADEAEIGIESIVGWATSPRAWLSA